MSAFYVICGAIGLVAIVLAWVANSAIRRMSTRQRTQQLHCLLQQTEASWAQTLDRLQIESAERRRERL